MGPRTGAGLTNDEDREKESVGEGEELGEEKEEE